MQVAGVAVTVVVTVAAAATTAGLLLVTLVVVTVRFKFKKSFGSYFSPIFSNRLKSSSNIDFFDKTDFKISDGFTSFTSSSRNLCRLEKLDADDGVVGFSLECDADRGGMPPFHISNISSRFLIRSSNDGLFPNSESLEFELNDGALHGLSGGCSTGSVAGGFNKLAVLTGLISDSVV